MVVFVLLWGNMCEDLDKWEAFPDALLSVALPDGVRPAAPNGRAGGEAVLRSGKSQDFSSSGGGQIHLLFNFSISS